MSESAYNAKRKRNNVNVMLKMQATLAKQPATYTDLVESSGLGRHAVMRWIKAMRAAGAVYVAEWKPDCTGRPFVPAFMLGVNRDVPRPGPRRTAAERMAAIRAARTALAEGEGAV